VTRHVPANVVDFPNPIEVVLNPFGAAVDASIAAGLSNPLNAFSERIVAFAGDRIIDIGATLLLMTLGVAITTVGVLRIFAATASTDTGRAAIGAVSQIASIKTGGKF